MKHINEIMLNEAKANTKEYEGRLIRGVKIFIEVCDGINSFEVHKFKKASELLEYLDFDMDPDAHYRPDDFMKALDDAKVGDYVKQSDYADYLDEDAIYYRVY